MLPQNSRSQSYANYSRPLPHATHSHNSRKAPHRRSSVSLFCAAFLASRIARAFSASSFCLASAAFASSCAAILASASARAFWHGPTWWYYMWTPWPCNVGSCNVYRAFCLFVSYPEGRETGWVGLHRSILDWMITCTLTLEDKRPTEIRSPSILKQLLEVVCGIQKKFFWLLKDFLHIYPCFANQACDFARMGWCESNNSAVHMPMMVPMKTLKYMPLILYILNLFPTNSASW